MAEFPVLYDATVYDLEKEENYENYGQKLCQRNNVHLARQFRVSDDIAPAE